LKQPLKHQTTHTFWKLYAQLPDDIRELADRNYELLANDPKHPSLHLKNIGSNRWSVRIGLHFRALAQEDDMVFTWVWIGTHEVYDRLIK
jgi:hypothetical protein